jgi:hypothetical protein
MPEDERPQSGAVAVTISIVALFDISGYIVFTWLPFGFGDTLFPLLGIVGGLVGLIVYNRIRTHSWVAELGI